MQVTAQLWLRVRVYKCGGEEACEARVEVETEVEEMQGNRELLLRWTLLDVDTQRRLVTLDSGLLPVERFHNESRHIAGNYYPLVTGAGIAGADPAGRPWALGVVAAHTHGCASLKAGELEVMLHRRLLQDDYPHLGVGQALNDTSRLVDTLQFTIGEPDAAERVQRELLQRQYARVEHVHAAGDSAAWASRYAASWRGTAGADLDPRVHLPTLAVDAVRCRGRGVEWEGDVIDTGERGEGGGGSRSGAPT